jgi:hypothetical protein
LFVNNDNLNDVNDVNVNNTDANNTNNRRRRKQSIEEEARSRLDTNLDRVERLVVCCYFAPLAVSQAESNYVKSSTSGS